MPPFSIEYIEQRLLDGNALAKAVLDFVPLQQGQVVSCLPQGVALTSLRDFRTGGKLPSPPVSEWQSTQREDETLLMIPVPSTDDWLAEKVRAFLTGDPERLCIFEDALKRYGDPVLSKVPTRYATFDKEVYHLLLSVDAQQERILKAIRTARSIPTFIGVMTKWVGSAPNSHHTSISSSTIRSLAERAEKIIVGAFDGEGYLVWHKPVVS
jgi:hypothetical protein